MDRGQKRNQYWIHRFWTSAPVRWGLKLAALTVRKKLMAPTVTARPTEVVLASAAAEIFDKLSPRDRAALSGVPELMHNLEAAAAALRGRVTALDHAMAAVGDVAGDPRRAATIEDMRAERERVGERLRSAVGALESLRLDLLRLQAGVGSTGDLTGAIDAGRAIGRDIDYTIAGRAEAARMHTPV
jgi:hypothetical protein